MKNKTKHEGHFQNHFQACCKNYRKIECKLLFVSKNAFPLKCDKELSNMTLKSLSGAMVMIFFD
jgi:hypothetical protein